MGADARWAVKRFFRGRERFTVASDKLAKGHVNERGWLARYVPNKQNFELEFYDDRLCLIEANQMHTMRYSDIERLGQSVNELFMRSDIERLYSLNEWYCRLAVISRDKSELVMHFFLIEKGDWSAIVRFILKVGW